MKIIDAWMQHPTKRLLQQPYFQSIKRWIKKELDDIPLEWTLKALADAKVDKALICAWYGPDGPLISNEEVLELTSKYPQLIGVASVDIRNPVEAVDTLQKYVQEHNFKALRIIQWLWQLPCSHALYYPLLTQCVKLNIPLCLQVGLTGPLMTSETGKPHHIERIALDFPDLKIVCGHIGYPWHIEMIAYATKFPNVYIDTSAYKANRYPKELVQFIKSHGRSKVMFGSNYPMIAPGECLKDLDSLELGEEVKNMFLFENAARVFSL